MFKTVCIKNAIMSYNLIALLVFIEIATCYPNSRPVDHHNIQTLRNSINLTLVLWAQYYIYSWLSIIYNNIRHKHVGATVCIITFGTCQVAPWYARISWLMTGMRAQYPDVPTVCTLWGENKLKPLLTPILDRPAIWNSRDLVQTQRENVYH